MSATTLVFLNRKGGVGKTSSTFHLAGALARSGRRVLLLDTDPQASLTQGFFGPEWTEAVPPGNTIAALFGDDFVPDPVALIVPTGIEGIHILPGSEHLNRYNLPEPEGDPRQAALRELIAEVRDTYDAILIDCPPNLCLCSWAALAAGDGVVVPVQPEDFGAQGLKKVQESVAAAQAMINPGLALLGYVITMFNKSLAVHAAYGEQLRAMYGNLVLSNIIPLAKDFKEAVVMRKPVAVYKPRSQAAKAMAALADELLARASGARTLKEVA
ncbi:MAG: ParA family protein [Singulisphaera sp.]|nr:ParA family protein [Singulisphaera sp.]